MNELLKTFVIFALTAAVFIFCGGMIKHYVWTPAVSTQNTTGSTDSDSVSDSVSASASNKNKDLSELSLDELIDVLN